jgi:hypothetical protein
MTLDAPPKDDQGRTLPHDHLGIEDEDILLRGVSKQWLIPDGNGGTRISSALISSTSKKIDPYEGLSVEIKKLLDDAGVDIYARFSAKYISVVSFLSQDFRAEGGLVGYDPLPDNPCHGAVWGDLRKPSSRKNRLMEKYNLLYEI